jgi:diguanylate cyclase (GGDEF)-like protein
MDLHTLHVEHVVLLLVYTLMAAANSWVHKWMKGIHWFSLYNALLLMGALSVALRGQIPDFFSIVVGNLFVVAGYAALFISLAELFGCRRWQYWVQAVAVGIAIVTMVQTGSIHAHTGSRLIAYSAVLGFQQLQIAWLLFRRGRGLRDVAINSLAVMLAALMLSNAARLVWVLREGAPQNYLKSGAFLAWMVILNSCLQCGAMVAYVWLTASLLRKDLEMQATTDPMTGLLNRRAFQAAAEKEFIICQALDAEIAAIIIDLDGFKQINDTCGHPHGDATLIAVARCLQDGMRVGDYLARIGGDEFAMVLPHTSLAEAETVAERLRHAIEQTEVADGERITRLTASFGVAARRDVMESWDQLMMECDRALYSVKKRGGNLVERVQPEYGSAERRLLRTT